MPPHKVPASLRQLSEASLVSSLTRGWPERLLEEAVAVRGVLEVVSGLPPALADSLAARLVERFVRVASGSGSPPSPLLVDALLRAVAAAPSLRTLDLSPLVRLGCVARDEDLRLFERSLAATTPPALAGLSLATHKNEFTLPTCSDALAAVLARRCGPSLTSLDLSCCNLVTDQGLALLARGCPRLQALMLFECSVTADGVAHALLQLHELTLLDYRDLATPIQHIHRRDTAGVVRLKLTHVSHVGFLETAPRKLQFHEGVARAVSQRCPCVTHLRVRLTDRDAALLCGLFPRLRSLELVFNVGAPSSPGQGLAAFLSSAPGSTLTTLALACNVLHADQCVLVARACLGLQQLWLRCNQLVCDATWRQHYQPTTPVFTRLHSFYVKVGETERCEGFVPARLLSLLLRDASPLASLQLVTRSDHVDDAWLREVVDSAGHQQLSKVVVAVPRLNSCRGALRLTQASVELLLARCPALRTLGNLLVWNLSHGQYLNLRDKLRAGNYDLNLVYRHMRIS